MNTRTFLAAAAVLLLTFSSQAFSQTYTLGYDQARYEVAEGGTIDIDIVLREQITGAEMSRLAAGGDDGLFAFGASVDYSVFTGDVGSTFASFTLDAEFDDRDAQVGGGLVHDIGVEVSFEGVENFGIDTDGEDGVSGRMITPTLYEITLGTVTFNAGSRGSTTSIQLQDHTDAGAVPFLFADGDTPEVIYATQFNGVSIVVVPEPSTAVFFTAIALTGILRRRR